MEYLAGSATTTTRRRSIAVVLSTVGVFTAISALSLLPPAPKAHWFSTAGLLQLLALEGVMAAYWIPRLRRDGWQWSTVTLPASGLDVLRGIGLWVFSLFVYVVVWLFVADHAPDYARSLTATQFKGVVSWWIVGIVSVLNPIAEEFLYLGFIATTLRGSSLRLALWGSVTARVAVHLYQGPLALIAIGPIGFVLTSYYLATRRIWPAVVAHSLMDVYALRQFIR